MLGVRKVERHSPTVAVTPQFVRRMKNMEEAKHVTMPKETETHKIQALPLNKKILTGTVGLPKRAITPPVVPEPFSVSESIRQKQLEEEQKRIALEKEEEEQKRRFVARPAKTSVKPFTPILETTTKITPQPFHLESVEKYENYKKKKEEELKAEKEKEEKMRIFKAQEAKVLSQAPFIPARTTRPLTQPAPPTLASDLRAEKRKSFEEKMKMKEEAAEKERLRKEEERKKKEEEEIARIRKETVFKAQPIKAKLHTTVIVPGLQEAKARHHSKADAILQTAPCIKAHVPSKSKQTLKVQFAEPKMEICAETEHKSEKIENDTSDKCEDEETACQKVDCSYVVEKNETDKKESEDVKVETTDKAQSQSEDEHASEEKQCLEIEENDANEEMNKDNDEDKDDDESEDDEETENTDAADESAAKEREVALRNQEMLEEERREKRRARRRNQRRRKREQIRKLKRDQKLLEKLKNKPQVAEMINKL
eukprot:MONOS_1104.1-p1 / transcript=MONOS_1104.1 / gene=MONOS_1104 / organism=Monocercomonoides_exilis_PA203 / gene_product=Targeting protein for Xklp2 (TPX2) / transcript_product=Targeting protein for Xklp2 (TPX2) / location=Mono_scaffold00018:225731-227351(-) / protein_length=483 / sequence_SO=supercontig / SO=protein_coding / is_pseudo=false